MTIELFFRRVGEIEPRLILLRSRSLLIYAPSFGHGIKKCRIRLNDSLAAIHTPYFACLGATP